MGRDLNPRFGTPSGLRLSGIRAPGSSRLAECMLTPPETSTHADILIAAPIPTVGVNHLGHFLLASLLTPTLATAAEPRLVVTASPVHDPTSGGGNVGSTATLGDLAGLVAKGAIRILVGADPSHLGSRSVRIPLRLCPKRILSLRSHRTCPIFTPAFTPVFTGIRGWVLDGGRWCV